MGGRNLARRVAAHLRSNVVAYIALFVALGGVAYAGVKPLLDREGSVDSANIKDGTVSRADLGAGAVGNSELSGKLHRQLGLAAKPPVDGTYVGAGKDFFSGDAVTITATWQNGVPTSAFTRSANPHCSSPTASRLEQTSATGWTLRASTPTQYFIVELQSLGSTQVGLSLPALIVNTPGGDCRVDTALLTLQR